MSLARRQQGSCSGKKGPTRHPGRLWPAPAALDAEPARRPVIWRQGSVNLRDGLGRDASAHVLNTPGASTGPAILGTGVRARRSSPGHIRAYDIRTGRLAWIFHTIPHPGETGYGTWPADAWKFIGGANCWAGMALDEKRGIVFVPTGSAAFDFWGGNRIGQNLFANCLLALDASTGKRLWHFQFVHHVGSRSAVGAYARDGDAQQAVDAVAQATNRLRLPVRSRGGTPLFPIRNIRCQRPT